jgi:putative CocE/NonD family hydrolase
MNFRKLNPKILMIFLALILSVFVSTTPATQVRAQQTCQEYDVPMRDGVALYTRVFLPDPAVWGPGPYPTILSTTPYGIGGFSGRGNCSAALPNSYATNGYTYVYQDNRGRFLSQGIWDRAGDGRDGYDTIEWIAEQAWCNGCKIGMTGASALGITTYLTAGQRPPHLVAILPQVATANNWNGQTFEGNALRLDTTLAWAGGQVAGLSASHIASLGLSPAQLAAAYAEYATVSGDIYSHLGTGSSPLPVTSVYWMHLPLYNFPAFTTFLPSLNDLFLHPSQDAARAAYDVEDKINVPGLHWGGWYDLFAQGNLEAFLHAQKNVGNQRLIMYNGGHNGAGAPLPYNPVYRWFDYWLKGIDTGIMDEPPILYFRMVDYPTRSGDWQYADQWPLPDVKKKIYYLHSNGTISTHFPNHKENSQTYLCDPNNPVPTMGGRNLYIPAGSMDQRIVEPPNRSDVLVYTSDVLENDVEVSGRVKVFLHASSNRKDTDFVAKLIDVYPDGSTMMIQDGVIRARYRESLKYEKLMHPGKVYEFCIDLGDTSQVFKAGHRIQIDITSSNFPRRDRNPNTGHALYIIDTPEDAVVAQNTIYHDAKHPSFVVLPIVHPQTRIFEGQASIKTPMLTYEGPAEFYTLAKGVYLRLTNLENRWVKWDIEHDCDTRFLDFYTCEGKLGKLSVWVHTEGREPYFASARGKGVWFKGTPKETP